MTVGRRLDAPRGERLRLALERLGPIFVKFGQVLSTRRDLLPPDVADELAQAAGPRAAVSRAPQARALVEQAFGQPHRGALLAASTPSRWPAPRSRRCTSPRCTTGARSRSRCCARACWRRSRTTWRCCARWRAGSSAVSVDGKRLQAARGGGRVRQLPARRARPGARGRQRRAAAAQHAGPGPGAQCPRWCGTCAPAA